MESPSVTTKPDLIKKDISAKTLPPETVVGTTITFNNTIGSNPDEFKFIYMLEISKKYNLDPKKDYEKILEMSQNPNVTSQIKESIIENSLSSYVVTEEITPPVADEQEKVMDYNSDFFKRFDYLEDSGIVEATPTELEGIQKVYIGGGTDTPAFASLEQGIYGDPDNSPTYFSTDYELAMSHMYDENGETRSILIEVSLPKLLELRKIFRDPESLSIDQESGKTFITFHGVPTSVIDRILVLKKIDSQVQSS